MFEFLNRHDFQKYKKDEIYKRLQKDVKEIAVYKGGGGLGDLVVAVSFFKTLKLAFPQAKIKYMGIIYPRFKRIFDSIPYIDGYIHYERPDKGKRMKEFFEYRKNNMGKIDLLIDTQRRWETSLFLKLLKPKYMLSGSMFLSNWTIPSLNFKKMHIFEQMFALPARLGIDVTKNMNCELNIADEFVGNADKILPENDEKFAALMPSCGMEFKNWPAEHFAKIGDLFANLGYTTIILGSPNDIDLFKSIAYNMKKEPIIPAESYPEFAKELMNDAAILQRCEIAVGNDSGGMHLASCLGVVSATIFGPTTPRKFSPIGPRNIIFYNKMTCSPCRFKCDRKIFRECLNGITPEAVFASCVQELKKERANEQ
ncbi:MAG: glycosyltransferase family 9 protein [Candidatus Omnitrophica bacterium]|nr:glycosyltransferase family 9 protein [Candidatus Omnitrophota bacterium]